MSAKQLVFDAEARRQLKTGIDALANAVKVTLGPRGRNVAIDKKWGAPTITHDGVTVAKEIELEDHFQNMGAQMLKQAATKTNDVAGDGTRRRRCWLRRSSPKACATWRLAPIRCCSSVALMQAPGRWWTKSADYQFPSRATPISSTLPPSPPMMRKSASYWRRPWRRSDTTASSRSRKARA